MFSTKKIQHKSYVKTFGWMCILCTFENTKDASNRNMFMENK